jgi:amidase
MGILGARKKVPVFVKGTTHTVSAMEIDAMRSFKEYDQFDGVGLAALIKNKEISPKELCEEAICRIDDLNPLINAVVTKMYDKAGVLINNGLPHGPLKGVPFLLKDLLASYASVPLTSGSKAYKGYIPDYDCELVKRFKKMGLVTLGKTNTPEFGLMGTTEPKFHGPTRNPWNVKHSPGGSSGGSAAAIASGMVPLASAGDGGGSIRIPASCCGLFGLKPSRGRNPTGPKLGRIWQDAAVEHVLSRSVRDSAVVLDHTNGPDMGAPYMIPGPAKPYFEEITRPPGTLNIAYDVKSPVGGDVHQECITAVENTAKLLEELGHNVEEDRPQIDGKRLARSYFVMYYGEVAADLKAMGEELGGKIGHTDIETLTRFFGVMGRAYSAGEFVLETRAWDAAARAMGTFNQKYDLYMTPTTAIPPAKIGELMPSVLENIGMKIAQFFKIGRLLKFTGIVNDIALKVLEKSPFTQLANMTGAPAMSVPLHWTAENLPVGVHFQGTFGNEATLFRLAGQLEDAKPWFNRRPTMGK